MTLKKYYWSRYITMETRYQLPILPEFSSQQVEPACCFHLLLLLGHFFRLAGYPLRSDVIYSSLWTKRWEGEGGGGGVESKVKANSRCGQKTTRNIILGLCPALWTFLQVVIPLLLDEVQEICRTSKSSDIYELCRADKRFIWFFSDLPPIRFLLNPPFFIIWYFIIYFFSLSSRYKERN